MDDPGAADRWIGAGGSTHPDVTVAVDEALESATGERSPALAVVFSSTRYPLAEVAALVADRLGDTPVIGCSTSGEVATSGPTEAGLAIWALGGKGFDVATRLGKGSADGLRTAAAEAARSVEDLDEGLASVLVLLADGLCGDQMEVVRGAYGVAGAAVPLVGGCAGDDLAMQRTEQLHGSEVTTSAVVAAAIRSDAPVGVGVAHGWREVGEPMLVTGSRGVVVETLDDRPALDVYLDAFDAPASVRDDEAAFVEFAVVRPLGIVRRDRTEIRYVSGADYDARTLTCIAEVPPGAAAHLMEGDVDTVLRATDAACQAALDGLDGRNPIGLLVFDCVARRAVLEDVGIRREIDRVAEVSGGAPVAGFYTYGEIARTRGAGGFHNQTLVVVAFA
ncbi:MAG: FIST signal transduction protein [Microthrixaceae bacterium]